MKIIQISLHKKIKFLNWRKKLRNLGRNKGNNKICKKSSKIKTQDLKDQEMKLKDLNNRNLD